jgi:hypothetical protein
VFGVNEGFLQLGCRWLVEQFSSFRGRNSLAWSRPDLEMRGFLAERVRTIGMLEPRDGAERNAGNAQ